MNSSDNITYYTGIERRAHKRIKQSFMAKFRFKPEAEWQTLSLDWDMVALKNLSGGGALFNYNKKIPVGTFVEMRINFPISKEPINCIGKVLRIDGNGNGSAVFPTAVTFTAIDMDNAKVLDSFAEAISVTKPENIDS